MIQEKQDQDRKDRLEKKANQNQAASWDTPWKFEQKNEP